MQIHGRIKDQFNLGGVKANAADIDAAACKSESVLGAVSFARRLEGRPDQLCVLATLGPGASPEAAAAEIRRNCAALRGKHLIPVAIYFAPELPLGATGKPIRERAMELCSSAMAY